MSPGGGDVEVGSGGRGLYAEGGSDLGPLID